MKDQSLNDEIYEQLSFPKRYTFSLLLLIIFLIFISIPWKSIFQAPSLSTLLGCPVQHSGINFKFFPPGPFVNSLILSTECTGLRQNVELQDVAVSFGGVSFSPLGPVFNVNSSLEKFPISLKFAVGINKINVSFYDEKLSLTKLNSLIKKYYNIPLYFSGTAKTDLRVSLVQNMLDEYQLQLNSQDLFLPPQNVVLLQVPELALKTLDVKFQGKKAKASLDNLTLGNANTLLLQSKGNLLFDFYNFSNSQIDLNVELKLSQKLNENFSILSTLLGSKKVGEGNFKFPLKGTIGSPSL